MESDTHGAHLDNRTLNRFADCDLPERSAAAARSHLRSCAACRREVQFIRALSATIRAMPAPKPPDGLFDELFPATPKSAEVISVGITQEKVTAYRGRVLSAGALLLAVVAAGLLLTVGPDRAMAGSSTLNFEWETPGALALRYETVSPLAAEPSVQARLRYWVPDSLRFAQTEPGYGVVELSREDAGPFSGVIDLPPGTVYAVAAVEDLDGNYIDSDFGRLWEYLETGEEGRPTLQARRYQLLATSDQSLARAAQVAEEAASQFLAQPEFRVPQILFQQSSVPPESRPAFLQEHAERLRELDRAAREGDPGPVELDALHRYAALLDRPDLASYWSDQLVSRYPRHGAAALVHLRSIARSPVTIRRKLDALEASWARTTAPAIAQVGLRFSIELADVDLVRKWLDRHSAGLLFRDLSYDTEIARDMMGVPALWEIAEPWILDRLTHSGDEMGSERPLNQSRRNFRADANERQARLNIYLAHLSLERGQLGDAMEAAERAVARMWNPAVFREAAEIHRASGSGRRATELLSLSHVDPVIPLNRRPSATGVGAPNDPSEEQLTAARAIMYERVTSLLHDERVDLTARLRSATGDETTLREVVRGEPVLIVQALRPDFVPQEALALLDLNSERLRAGGVRALLVAQHPPSAELEQSDFGPGFFHDVQDEVWGSLRAWREVQYFVLDQSGRLRHRGEDPETALRIALALSM